jgi:hypothetical protein
VVLFDDAGGRSGFDAALDFGQALALAPGIPKRNVAVLARPLPGFVAASGKAGPWAEVLPGSSDAALVVVAAAAGQALQDLVARFGGRITHRAESAEAQRRNQTLLEMCWNHSTLHALKVDAGRTYLQCSFTAGQHLEQVRAVHARYGRPAGPGAEAEVLMHVEFIRSGEGPLICTALPLVRYTGEERLEEIIAGYRALGVRVNNPHHRHVEDGRFGGTLPAAAVAAKRRLDPLNLLNPGKLRVWPVPD